MTNPTNATLLQTPLHALHEELGGKMVPFAGYHMPVQYGMGIIKEHKHCREQAGLFDVGHMGQAVVHGQDAAKAMELLVPGDIQGLAEGGMRYTQFTNEVGGILDDLMVTNLGDKLFLVVNAARKEHDFDLLRDALPLGCTLETLEDHALLALQGPKAAEVMGRHAPATRIMGFMTMAHLNILGVDCRISRSGYTGEDGYEISLPASEAAAFAAQLLQEPEVEAVGLGARDSLRLEAGLCLYGQDITEYTTPVEAGLLWSISKRRRAEGGYPGDMIIQNQIFEGIKHRRVGIRPDGRMPTRAGDPIIDPYGTRIGEITSGGFGPSIGGPVAMGYIEAPHAKADTPVILSVRGKLLPATVVKLPFVEQRYYRG
ncbi:glycine cleavage system aminomethyltransferase GcvT [Magnetospira sp. QH-2]|uniref:glycine cleavage system aminomethyltransferase GcvT n=1 Tax=Magnetospira sp. (strain QH-2) TaxID=1288970 RepID=UPI0003E81586|nr:glycine cleavage system aminomethyltransferase GcvT [Magnetospira sp. QH-2]CCQ72742.1 glycine cleavage system T-protein (aminomethyltransferase) [Magnetospira sp. QH-2]